MRVAFALFVFSCITALTCPAQGHAQSLDTQPVTGLRDIRPGAYALTGATVVVRPGEILTSATVLILDQQIQGVGEKIFIPDFYQQIDCSGKHIYAGFVDAWSEQEIEFPNTATGYWNQNISPQRNVAETVSQSTDAEKLRKQGFAARLVAPRGGIIKGASQVYLLGGEKRSHQALKSARWQHAQLTVPRSGPRVEYPNSPMGAVALLRQAFYDAQWYTEAWKSHHADATQAAPEFNGSLEILSKDMKVSRFVFDAPNERMALRADQIAREFALQIAIRGSGREYRDIKAIAAMNRPLLIPLDFPDAPSVQDAQSRETVSLQDLMHWDLAPTNPGVLQQANVTFCITTDGLDDLSAFLKNLRRAIVCGLNPDHALASLTTVPTKLLGLENQLGTVEKGKIANLAIFDGEFSSQQSSVCECWVAGSRYQLTDDGQTSSGSLWSGNWEMDLPIGNKKHSFRLKIDSADGKLTGLLEPLPEKAAKEGDAAAKEGSKKRKQQRKNKGPIELKSIQLERDRLSATCDLSSLQPESESGVWLITIVQADPSGELNSAANRKHTALLSLQTPSGDEQTVRLVRLVGDKSDGQREDRDSSNLNSDDSEGTNESISQSYQPTDTPILLPLGAYGLEDPVRKQDPVVLRNAELWTCGPQGIVHQADVYIKDGLIAAIGRDLIVPKGTEVIDLKGKHVTPGLIDCHSHMGTDGGVNESGQVVTSEVRIGDFIDNSDINIYRQLAGGLTVANILHGSANPIGGQNQVIKLRWGDSMEGLKMDQAPPGIKFALGENVKRNQGRYPNTRMGVEQILRDQLLAAREYESRWRAWRSGDREGLPPRVDLQLQALSEVQRGERWIHCHSYRQDEIVATLGVLEEFGIRIGTLQHILEGYKVADRIKQHGAMASAFSDWWAYKFEVFDAIPYNGSIMHEQGVVVSFNSDDRELARHLNTEAAKATKYGGVPEEEALKFVTLNPAKQLRIENLVGSIEVGKHADFVVWSGRPLSTLTRCEQTWIDGKKYFDINHDQELRERDRVLRSRLIQKAMKSEPAGSVAVKQVSEEDRWVRKDIYCAVHGGLRHETTVQGAQE